jgi:hypothetical protein
MFRIYLICEHSFVWKCALADTSETESFLKDNKWVNRLEILPLSILEGRVIRRFASYAVMDLTHRTEFEPVGEIFAALQHWLSA